MTQEEKIKRYIDGLYTRNEANEALQALAGPDGETLFNRLADTVAERAEACPPWTDEAERQRLDAEAAALLRQLTSPHKKNIPLRRKWLSVAAGIAALVSLSVCGVLYLNRLSPKVSVDYREVAASYGEVKTVLLPDGTQVSLNACSRLVYPEDFANAPQRTVTLHGQGFFKVARNERQPFVVKTANLDVKVLGTEFDIKSYAGDEVVSVNVKSGKVQVDMPDVSMKLYADEQFHYNILSNNLNKQAEELEVAAWQHGELQFNNTPIQDVARELERVFHCTVTFAPGQCFDNKITGSHTNESVESVLESLAYISGIRYKKADGQYILYK